MKNLLIAIIAIFAVVNRSIAQTPGTESQNLTLRVTSSND